MYQSECSATSSYWKQKPQFPILFSISWEMKFTLGLKTSQHFGKNQNEQPRLVGRTQIKDLLGPTLEPGDGSKPSCTRKGNRKYTIKNTHKKKMPISFDRKSLSLSVIKILLARGIGSVKRLGGRLRCRSHHWNAVSQWFPMPPPATPWECSP